MRSNLFYEKIDLLRIKAHLTHSVRDILQLYCVLVRTQPQQLLVGNIHMEIIRRYLTEAAKKKGIKFGIWIEPEMVNPKSELYEKHKDWVIHLPNRDEYYFRKHHLNRSRHKFHSPPGK